MRILALGLDLLQRLLLILFARWELRRPRSVERQGLKRATLAVLFRAAAGHLAIAHALLPAALRRETRVAYLLCRVLDAEEDLTSQSEHPERAQAMLGVLQYLAGTGQHLPSCDRIRARDARERIDQAIAQSLPQIRRDFCKLPADAQSRVLKLGHSLVEPMSQSLGALGRQRRAEGATYGSAVLGQIVLFAVQRVQPACAPRPELCRATGRLLQLANDIRDIERDLLQPARGEAALVRTASGDVLRLRQKLLLTALADVPMALRLLHCLAFDRFCGARGAAALMGITTAAFFLRNLSLRLPWILRWPLASALLCALSQRQYVRVLDELDECLCGSVADLTAASPLEKPPRAAGRSALRDFARHLACAQPDPLAQDCYWVASCFLRSAEGLYDDLPEEAQRAPLQPTQRARLLASDFLLLAAASCVGGIGPRQAAHFARWMTAASLRLYAGGCNAGLETITLLSGALAQQLNLSPTEAALLLRVHALLAQALTQRSGAELLLHEAQRTTDSAPAAVQARVALDVQAARHILRHVRC